MQKATNRNFGRLSVFGLLGFSVFTGATSLIATPVLAQAPCGAFQKNTVKLKAVVRDFKGRWETNGHDDFEVDAFGEMDGNVDDFLDSDGKPIFTGLGKKVDLDWDDGKGEHMDDKFFDAALGDVPGIKGLADMAAITSAASFAQWFRNIPGVNASTTTSLDLNWDAFKGKFVFDSRFDKESVKNGGFFPINKKLFGNTAGATKNSSFTIEISAKFVYHKGKNEKFKITSDGDAFVFIDGELVIDMEGVHKDNRKTVKLDRIKTLVDGTEHEIKIFAAQRNKAESNFAIETNLCLTSADLPNTQALYD